MPSRRFLTSCWTLFTDLLNIYLYKLHQLKGPSAISTPTSAHPQCHQGKKIHVVLCGLWEISISKSLPKLESITLQGQFFLPYQSSRNRMEKRSPVDTFSCLKQLGLDFFFPDFLSSLRSTSPSSCFLGQSLPKNIYIWNFKFSSLFDG